MSDAVKGKAPPPPAAAPPPRWRLVFPADVQTCSFVLLIAAVVFSNGIRGQLTFDDHLAITKNADSWADKTTLSSIFFNDFWGKSLDRFESNGSYRPITVLTFRVQQWLMGYRHSPAFLHLFNYAVAYLNVVLVFYLARLYVYVVVPSTALPIDGAAQQSFTAVLTSPLHAVPLMAALLYLVHPVHVDAVTSIVGRCELLYCFFGLIGLFCTHRYLNEVDEAADTAAAEASATTPPAKGRPPSTAAAAAVKQLQSDRKRQSRAQRRTFTTRYVVFAAYSLIVSILCKDSAITFTAIYSMHAAVMYACGRCKARRALLVTAAAVLELVGYLVFRATFVGNVDLERSPLLRQTENPQYFVPKGVFHWLSIRWVIQVKNLELLLFPTSLCCEYSFNCIPHMYDLHDPRVPVFAVVTAVVVLAVLGFLYGAVVARSRTALVGLLGFLWMAIPYAPVSHLFIAVGTFIAERCLYVPSIGAVLLLTFLVAAPGLRRGVVAPYFYALLLLCVGWGVMSHRRNVDWWDDERLFRAATRTCPNSGKAYSQLAALISSREKRITPEIVELAERSVTLDPKLRDGYYYLAVNEVNNRLNWKKAYHYLRLCTEDPFAVNTCHETYDKVRDVLFPNMTEVEKLTDYANLTRLDSQKAAYIRQAAVIALQMYARPCYAHTLLDQALTLWHSSKLYWLSDQVRRMSGDATYCNAVYWYGQSLMQCEAQRMAGVMEAGDAASDDSDEEDSAEVSRLRRPPTPQEAAERSLAVAERFRRCDTDWHQVLSEPKYNLPTIPHRMTQYLTIGDSSGGVVNRYINYTARDTPERNEVLLSILDITVRQFCHLQTLVSDEHVRREVSVFSMDALQALERGFPSFRQKRSSDMRTMWRELKMATTLTDAQRGRLAQISAMASCSSDLTFLDQ
ncbi:hypothetical protein NESM_000291800 [Novymonas esmeraldas]|uniref:DUF1736 domain-containing protein n=1 Tax=Novymonas esmeraldas TaxID=1808958 RepID=A0AAW0F7M0_9TRYP